MANIYGTDSVNVLTGYENENDIIYAYGANDTLYGLGGNDYLDGGTGNDWMYGGLGSDEYIVDSFYDHAIENYNEGYTDSVVAEISSYTLPANIEDLYHYGSASFTGTGNGLDNLIYSESGNDNLKGGLGNDWLSAGAGNDVLSGDDGDDILEGGSGSDTMMGGKGDDWYYVGSTDTIKENVGEGTDRIKTSIATYVIPENFEDLIYEDYYAFSGTGNVLNNRIEGSSGNDTIQGLGGNDDLYGFGGNNTLNGGSGNDTLNGGEGSDILDGGSGADSMWGDFGNDTYYVDNANDSINETSSSGGTDTVISTISRTLGSYQENLILSGTGAINATGNSLANRLTGNTASNILNGGTGADIMSGGLGNDTYYVDNSADVVTEASSAGTDTVISYLSAHTLAANIENGRIMSTGSANLTGNSLNNVLYAGAGNNVLNGSSGIDTASYAYGTKSVTVSLAITTSQATGGSGSDTLTAIENLTGSGYTDRLTGNTTNNILNGGAGADTMTGGLGNDTYYVDNSADVVTEASSAGTDTVIATISRTLGSDQENLILSGTAAINATGNSLANRLTGNTASNILNGGTGADIMSGGLGNDTYYVDNSADVVTEASSAGTDTVISYLSAHTLAANIENGRIMSTGSANLTGNSFNNVLYAGAGNNVLNGSSGIDTVSYAYASKSVTVSLTITTSQATGGSGSDTLTAIESLGGSGYADRLTGNTANNILNGGAGADIMSGGLGNDTYYVDNSADVVTEAGSAGTDTVISYLSAHTLASNVENGLIMSAGIANLAGNSLNNVLYAGAGNNVVNGSSGIDTASYLYATKSVTVSLAITTSQATGGSGSDTLTGIENLTGSSYADRLTGNNTANVLTGDGGNDTLSGGMGKDLLSGGAGNDIFDFNAISETGLTSSSWDVISDFVRGSDKIDLSTLDANTSTTTNDAFTQVIGSTSTFNAAGQLKLSNGVVYGNTDTDISAEFAIQLTGVSSLTISDFIV